MKLMPNDIVTVYSAIISRSGNKAHFIYTIIFFVIMTKLSLFSLDCIVILAFCVKFTVTLTATYIEALADSS